MQDRRSFLGRSLAGIVLSFGSAGLLRPATAKSLALPFSMLSPQEAATLSALGDTLLPGADAAGVAHFVDHQLSVPPNDSMLIARYFNVRPPYYPFYKKGLAALEQAAQARFTSGFAALSAARRTELVEQLRDNKLAVQTDIPLPLFYTLVRSDAIDVVYGDEEGFARLDVPYMAHINPPGKWS